MVFIVDPVRHRRAEAAQGLQAKIDQPDLILVMPPDDDWACDLCNANIPIRAADSETSLPVPVVESYALCPPCFIETLSQQGVMKASVCDCFGCTTPNKHNT